MKVISDNCTAHFSVVVTELGISVCVCVCVGVGGCGGRGERERDCGAILYLHFFHIMIEDFSKCEEIVEEEIMNNSLFQSVLFGFMNNVAPLRAYKAPFCHCLCGETLRLFCIDLLSNGAKIM
jgi:hypothetical protein